MKQLKKLTLTLALLIAAVTSSWASGEIVVTVTAADLQANQSTTFTKDGVTIKCYDRMQEGLAFSELYEMSTTLGYFTKIEITNQYPEGIYGINGINGFSVNGSVATWTGKASSVGLGHYSVGPVVQFVFTIEPAGIDVTYNDAHTEASFKMPQYDVTATYTIKRDMTLDMPVTVQDAEQNSRFRVQKQGNAFQPVGMDAQQVVALFKVHDDIEGKDLTINTDYTIQIFTADEDGNATGNAMTLDAFTYAPGDYVAKAVAVDGSNYSGTTAQSNLFTLFQGYEISVAAGEYATFYKDEALYVEDTDAQLYTITAVGNATATATELSVAAANTPLLVKNNASETKTILLIPTTDKTPDSVTPATEFKGTLTATQIAASTTTQNNYAWNGLKFVWVKNALAIGANKCWLEVGSSKNAARALTIVFGDGDTTGIDSTERTKNADDEWYDLSGHKLQAAPKRKGVYIRNGRKEVVK